MELITGGSCGALEGSVRVRLQARGKEREGRGVLRREEEGNVRVEVS